LNPVAILFSGADVKPTSHPVVDFLRQLQRIVLPVIG